MHFGNLKRHHRGGNPVDGYYEFDSGMNLRLSTVACGGGYHGTATLELEYRALVFSINCQDVFGAFDQIRAHYRALPLERRQEFMWGHGGIEAYRQSVASHLRQD